MIYNTTNGKNVRKILMDCEKNAKGRKRCENFGAYNSIDSEKSEKPKMMRKFWGT